VTNLYESLIRFFGPRYDGHIHTFDHTGRLNMQIPDYFKGVVGFCDIDFDAIPEYEDRGLLHIYDSHIKYLKNNTLKYKEILLATGISPKQAIEVYEKYPEEIRGFGELKCYATHTKGDELVANLPYANLDYWMELFNYNIDKRLPIYIHYNLSTRIQKNRFEKLLKEYTMFPIILCHCGMSYKTGDNDVVFDWVVDMAKQYNNLYLDVSYAAMDYFLANPNKLLMLPQNRTFIGSDINIKYINLQRDPQVWYNKCLKIYKYIPTSDANIKKLFNI